MHTSALIDCRQLIINNGDENSIPATLSLSAGAGSIISLIGPDHEMTSCLLQTLAGITDAESGQLFLAGRDTREFEMNDWVRARTGFGYVRADTALLSAANALQNLMLAAMYHQTGEAGDIKKQAEQLLRDLDAGDNLDLLPAYLKKQQRYKIAVARALLLKPLALLLDEPFAALELSSVQQFKQYLLNKVNDEKLLLVLVTQDIEFALAHSDQIIYFSKQQLLHFDRNHRIQDCAEPEVIDYLSLSPISINGTQ